MGKAFEPYAAAVIDNGVTGLVLLDALTCGTEGHALLEKELGISSQLHRSRILTDLQQLQEQGKRHAQQQAEEKEREEKRLSKDCQICYERERCMMFLPCAHLCACESCASQIQGAAAAVRCPIWQAGRSGGQKKKVYL